jgi:hypothetical protein
MIINKNKNSYSLNINSLKERKEILNGYESKKYLNKQYTSKTKRHLKTRDKSSKKKNTKKYKNNNQINTNIIDEPPNNNTLTKSLEEKYCKIPELIFSSIVSYKLDQIHDEWIII